VFLAALVFLSGGSSKTQQKTLYKKIVPKSFYKKSATPPPPPPMILDFFGDHVFGAFLGEGSSKTLLQKHRENKSDPGPFLASA
jgi:hypothetical protein